MGAVLDSAIVGARMLIHSPDSLADLDFTFHFSWIHSALEKGAHVMPQTFRKYLPTDRSKLRYWLVVSGFALADVTPEAFALGTLFLLIGMALHLWAKGTLRQNEVLAQTGPYRWVRHPFYLANALIDLGLCLIINRIEVLIIFFLFWIIAYGRAVRREERTLETLFGHKFTEYRTKTPCFVPWRFSHARGLRDAFSWQNPNIAKGSEVPRLLRLTGYPLLFVCGSELRGMGADFFTEFGIGVLGLWGFLFLSCISFIVNLKLRKQRLAVPAWATTLPIRNAFVLCLVSYAFLLQSLEMEMDYTEFLVGALISLALFLLVLIGRRSIESEAGVPMLMEGLILIVICFLAELPWLSFLPLAYYSGMWVNASRETDTMAPYAFFPHFNESWIRLQVILTAGVGLMVWKESFDDLRGFLVML